MIKRKMIIWGVNKWTSQFLKFIKETPFKITVIVSTDDTLTKYNDIQVLSPHEYLLLGSHPSYIVVFAEDIKTFSKQVKKIKDEYNFENAKILHPAFLVNYIQVKFKDKFLITGANRSGSTLLFTVIKNLLDIKNMSESSKKREKFFKDLSKAHFDILLDYLDSVFNSQGADYTGNGAVTFGNIDYFGAGKEICFFMSPIKSQRFIFDQVHRTYTNINSDLIKTATKFDQKIFVPLRNPLDIIVSNAFELEYVFFKMFPGEELDVVESEFRENYGRAHLCNLDWFKDIACYVKKHMNAFLNNKADCIGVKYEDIINSPIEKITEIAGYMGIPDISPDRLRDLWEKKIFNKPLAKFKAHMFRPGAGKWREYLCEEHIEILKVLGYTELLTNLEYDFKLESSLKLNDHLVYDKNCKRLEFVLNVRDYGFKVQAETALCYSQGNFHEIEIQQDISQPIRFTSNSRNFFNGLNELLFSDVFNSLITCLDIN